MEVKKDNWDEMMAELRLHIRNLERFYTSINILNDEMQHTLDYFRNNPEFSEMMAKIESEE